MSNRNRRIKPIDANLRKEITVLENNNQDLHEENSQLRNLIDQQNDYIKEELKEVRQALTEQHQYHEFLSRRLEDERKLRRRMDNQLREEIAAVGTKLRVASHTWLGKFIFK
nr:hypothetical protein [uncultured Aminipila sp.]